jgi:hypothetical protein
MMSFDYERWKQSQFGAMEQENTAAIPFPTAVAWAGTIWATIGVLALLSVAILSLQTNTVRTPGSALGGLLFLYGGVRAMNGTTPGTFRSGVASILLGFVWVAAGFMMPTLGRDSDVVVKLVSWGFGAAVISAGVLAVGADSSYKRWRNAQARGSSRYAGR